MTGHSGYDSAHKGLTAYLIIRQTFGSTAKREKITFILEQVLCQSIMLMLCMLTKMLIHGKLTIIAVTGLPIPTSSRPCPSTNFINENQY